MAEIFPWDVVPSWTADKLVLIGTLAKAVRVGTLKSLDKPGDNAYSIGCVFISRWRTAAIDAAIKHPWFAVINRSLQVVITIDGVPLRLWRAKDEDSPPPERYTIRTPSEIRAKVQAQLPLFGLKPTIGDSKWFWRLRMITDKAEQPIAFILEQCTEEGQTRYPWRIPITEEIETVDMVGSEATTIAAVPTALAREAVELPPLAFDDVDQSGIVNDNAVNEDSSER